MLIRAYVVNEKDVGIRYDEEERLAYIDKEWITHRNIVPVLVASRPDLGYLDVPQEEIDRLPLVLTVESEV